MSNDITPSAPRPPAPPVVGAGSPAPLAHAAVKRPQPQVPPPAAPAKPDPKESKRALEEAAQHLNKQMNSNKRDLSFSVDELANQVVVTVKNRNGEVVRQIPSEVALRVAHNMENMKGLLQDSKS